MTLKHIIISQFEPCARCIHEYYPKDCIVCMTGISPSNTYYHDKMENGIYNVTHRCGADFYYVVHNGGSVSCAAEVDTLEEAEKIYQEYAQ